jgi:hypothetical protein
MGFHPWMISVICKKKTKILQKKAVKSEKRALKSLKRAKIPKKNQ